MGKMRESGTGKKRESGSPKNRGKEGVGRSGQRCEIRSCKQRGEWAELCFMARAAGRGLRVTKPHGESSSYDIGVEHEGRYVRVQVKSTSFERNGAYACNIVSKTGVRYEAGKLDVFAVYLVPIDLWYIIPFAVAARNKSLNLTPVGGRKFAQYIEAWHLLRGDEGR